MITKNAYLDFQIEDKMFMLWFGMLFLGSKNSLVCFFPKYIPRPLWLGF